MKKRERKKKGKERKGKERRKDHEKITILMDMKTK